MQLQIWLSQIDSGTVAESVDMATAAVAAHLEESMGPIQPLDCADLHPMEIVKLLLATEGCSCIAALRRTR